MNKDELLLLAKRRIVKVDLPEGSVHVRSLNVAELREMFDKAGEDTKEAAAVQVSVLLCDDQGVPIFTLEEARVFVSDAPGVTVLTIVNAGTQLNSVNEKAVETARGN